MSSSDGGLTRPRSSPRPRAERHAAGGRRQWDACAISVLADIMCLACLAEEMLKRIPEKRERWLADVADAQRRVAKHYDPAQRVLHEFAHPVRGVEHDTPNGRLLNPGHSIEVAWFLLRLCEVRPDAQLHHLALDALEGSLERGWDAEQGGGLFYMLDVHGEPLADATVTAEHKLWWPLCEALYGCMLALELTRDEARWLPWLQRCTPTCTIISATTGASTPAVAASGSATSAEMDLCTMQAPRVVTTRVSSRTSLPALCPRLRVTLSGR